MPRAVVKAKARKRLPLIKPMTFSEIYLEMYAPPDTARPVASPCAAIAPPATLSGFCAALSAIVERNDLSPNSAANTRPKVLRICALNVEPRGTRAGKTSKKMQLLYQ